MNFSDKLLNNGDILKFLDYHHNSFPSQNKSIWTIQNPCSVEENLVNQIITKEYIETKENKIFGFNVLRRNDKLEILGKDILSDKLYLSKFFNNNQTWHGYPVNHKGNNADKPNDFTLDKLIKNDQITTRERKRIRRGQPL